MESEAVAEAEPFRIVSLIPGVYLPTLLFSIGQGAVLPIVPLFARELGASVAVAGLIVAMRGLGTMFADLPSGVMESRFGDKTVSIIGTGMVVVVAFGASLAGTPLQFAALIFFMGAGWSLWFLARLSFISQAVPVEQRGRALALVGGTNRLGTFIGPILGGVLAGQFGLEAAFYLQAVLGACAVAVIVVCVKNERPPETHLDGMDAYRRIFATAREHRYVLATAGMVGVSLQLLRLGREVLIPLWGDSIDLDVAQIGLIFGISSLLDAVLFYPTGSIMDTWGRKWAATPCLVILALSLALMPLTGSFWGMLAVGLLSGFGNGLGTGVGMTLGVDFSPPDARGEFLGMWRFISDVGTSAGPLVIGGITAVGSLGLACIAIAGIGFGGAAIMAFLVPETLRRRQPAPD
jgi:MFS family permease